jgi:hypothetical protein
MGAETPRSLTELSLVVGGSEGGLDRNCKEFGSR